MRVNSILPSVYQVSVRNKTIRVAQYTTSARPSQPPPLVLGVSATRLLPSREDNVQDLGVLLIKPNSLSRDSLVTNNATELTDCHALILGERFSSS